jgi:hypothetical protein
MRAIILFAVLILTVTTAIIATADTRHYYLDGGKFVFAGSEPGHIPQAQVCMNVTANCIRFGPGLWCLFCHSQPVDQKRYDKDSQLRHQRIHFPKYALSLSEGQQIQFGIVMVSRNKGVLIVQDQQGRRFQLPPDALLVKDKNGKPAFITYMNENPPQSVK